MKHSKKILVTGACGFIGFHLAKRLSEFDIELHCIDNFSNSAADNYYENLTAKSNVIAHNINLETDDLANLDSDFDLVFHFAAKNGTSNFYSSPFEVLKSASLPTINLIEHFKNFHGRFILASTSENYAGGINKFNFPIPTPEDVPLIIEDINNPRWSYASGKIFSESALIASAHQFNFEYTIIRIHNVYGPRMGYNHFIPDYINRILNGEFLLYGAEQTRSFLFVEDACRLLIQLAKSELAKNQIVNLGNDQEVCIKDIALKINALCGLKEDIKYEPAPKGSVDRRVPNLNKLRMLVGRTNYTSLDTGLSETIAYYKGYSNKNNL